MQKISIEVVGIYFQGWRFTRVLTNCPEWPLLPKIVTQLAWFGVHFYRITMVCARDTFFNFCDHARLSLVLFLVCPCLSCHISDVVFVTHRSQPISVDSPGKSGARFYQSYDRLFILKTLTSEEVERMHSFLKHYHPVSVLCFSK